MTVERVFFQPFRGYFAVAGAGGLRYIHGSPTVHVRGRGRLAPVRTATAIPVSRPSHDLPLFLDLPFTPVAVAGQDEVASLLVVSEAHGDSVKVKFAFPPSLG